MTQPKHIITFVLMLIVFGLSAKAQSTLRSPYEGATHVYTVDGITVGAGYEFYMTENADGSGLLDDDLTGEFDIMNKTGIIDNDGLASTPVQWNLGASAHIYYLWLEVTGESGCTNNISLRITPQPNQFDLLSENIPETNTTSCPAVDTADGFNPDAGTYSSGFTSLVFKVSRENGTDNPLTADAGDTYNWSFIPELAVDPDLGLNNVIITVEGLNSGVITANASERYTINGLDDEVTVTVSIENAPGYDLDVNLRVTGQQEENTNLSDSDPSNDDVTHTIQVMPVIGGMGGV